MKTWREMVGDLVGGELKQDLQYTFMAGLLAHGYMLFNKLSWRGDLNRGFTLPVEKAISLGRWFKAMLCTLVAKVFGGKNLSLPLLFGIVSILFIGLSAHVIIRLFDIRRKSLRMSLCCMMVVFPVVTSTFAYMFDAPYYFFAMLLAVLGVYIAARRSRWDGFIVGTLCVGGCLSIYQAYFPIAVTLAVILLFFEIANGQHETLPKAILRGVYFLAVCGGALVLFFVSWKLIMRLMNLTANDYQGASSIGESGIKEYVRGVKRAYRRFLYDFKVDNTNLYPMKLSWVQRVLLAASAFGGLFIAVRQFRKNKLLALLLVALIAILPLCCNLIYVMAASSPADGVYIYTLMLYGQCMLYVFLICAVDHILNLGVKPLKVYGHGAVAVLALMICLNIYLANACYLKAEFEVQQNISQVTVMVARIKSLEGYNDKMPVSLVSGKHKDKTTEKNADFEDLIFVPYDQINPYHSDTYLINYMRRWCGFSPEWRSSDDFKKLEVVQQMPDYPDDGSMMIIDDTVVVKW